MKNPTLVTERNSGDDPVPYRNSVSDALLDVALSHCAEGRPVISIKPDKRPYRKGWDQYFTRSQTEKEVRQEFSNGAHGLAVVLHPACPFGVLDYDGPHAIEAWQATGIELPETARNISRSGYDHLFFRMPANTPAGLKRAIRLVEAPCDCKDAAGESKPCGVDLLVNGYVILPPTPGYREDPDHPLESAALMPQAVLELAIKKQKEEKDRPTGDVNGKINHGKRKATACSLAGTMRKRGMSIEAIEAALKADSEARFNPPLDDDEIENILESAVKWPESSAVVFEHCTDLGNARRLVTQHGDEIRYSTQSGFYVWDGRRWEQNSDGAVERFAKATVRNIYAEAAQCDDKDIREKIAAHAHRSESDARIKAMVALAKSELEIVVKHDDLDRAPWLLNVANGTLNLETGELQPHSGGDLITRLIPIDYHPGAASPTWLRFLERVAGADGELITFLQKAVGYSLTGSMREQCFFILYGAGLNGKSTFLKIVSTLLADYAKQTGTETLLVKRGDQIPNDVARLAGARFVSAVETESGRRLAEGLVKQMTGGDRMTARFLHREFFEFDPTFKLWLAVNHKPRITGTDHAIWRRIRLVPFTVTIPESERDPDLCEKLKKELPGVLAWAVEGCALWRQNGLTPPGAITTATKEYRQESDVIASFIGERCKVGPDCEVSKAELYKVYAEWCEKSGERAVSKKEFGTRLSEKGFSDDRTKKGRFWLGIELEDDDG